MTKADSYISKGGRTARYDRAAFTDDLVTLSVFLAWAEEDGAIYGGTEAKDAFQAACRMLDVDPVELRKIALG